jgi:hypothetical protein
MKNLKFIGLTGLLAIGTLVSGCKDGGNRSTSEGSQIEAEETEEEFQNPGGSEQTESETRADTTAVDENPVAEPTGGGTPGTPDKGQ